MTVAHCKLSVSTVSGRTAFGRTLSGRSGGDPSCVGRRHRPRYRWLPACGAAFVASIALCWVPTAPAGPPPIDAGSIQGVVTHLSTGRPLADTEVVLRVGIEGQLVPAGLARTDARGRYCFPDLPADGQWIYVPGANYQQVHYPGRRVCLTSDSPHQQADIQVREVARGASPLRTRSWEIDLQIRDGKLVVREQLEVENPTKSTFVGRAPRAGHPAVTFQLNLPHGFERVTFTREFYGRRFAIRGNHLVTDLPWTPGRRRIELRYALPADRVGDLWQRRCDLPCDALTLRLPVDCDRSVSWSLAGQSQFRGKRRELHWQGNPPLPAGTPIRVHGIGGTGNRHTVMAWGAVGLLLILCLAATGQLVRLKRRGRQDTAVDDRTPQRPNHGHRAA